MGKGDAHRPMFISMEEHDLRMDLALGRITEEEFWDKLKETKNTLNGKKVKN